MASVTLKPAATGLRSGYDYQQHRPESATTAVCGAGIREQRYHRPDFPRCLDCVDVGGIDVASPAAEPEIPELEQRALFGDR